MIEGCYKCQDDCNLNSEELSWMPYHGGETLMFKSVSGVYDTLIVGQKTITLYTGMKDQEADDHSNCSYSDQELDVLIGPYPFYLSHHNIYAAGYNLNLAGHTPLDGNPYIGNESITQNAPQNNVVLNGRTFNNVYNFHYMYDYLYYTKQDGLIAFKETTNNDTLLYVKIN